MLFGSVASAATANRTIVALGDDELVVARLVRAQGGPGQAWSMGGAPPVVAAALNGDRLDEPLCIDLDATLITAPTDDKDGAAVTYTRGEASTRCWPTSTAATDSASPSPASGGPWLKGTTSGGG